MFTAPALRRRSFLSALVDLVAFQPAATLRRSGARAAQRRGEEALDGMSSHLLEDIGPWSGDGCVTDWGLLESAERLRRGWS